MKSSSKFITNVLFTSGSSRRIENLLDFDQMNSEKSCAPICQTLNDQEGRGNPVEPSILNQESITIVCGPSEHLKNFDPQVDSCVTNGLPMLGSMLPCVGGVSGEGAPSIITGGINEVSVLSSDQHASNVNVIVEGSSTLHNPVDLGQFFQEGHCNAMERNGCNGLTKVTTEDVESSSRHCQRVIKPVDGENEEVLGGIFAFSEEGKVSNVLTVLKYIYIFFFLFLVGCIFL